MTALLKKLKIQSPATVFLILAVISGTGYAYWRSRPDRITQPIAFNHRAHVTKAQIECSECHVYYSKGARSGLPDSETCMTCHSEAVTKSPEEARLRESYQQGRPILFRKLFHLPEHVYYSHRRHVVLGKLQCVRCHGKIADTDAPPSRPLVNISMDFCTDCHKREKVTNDCKSCHR